jgi:DNA-binding response OmpR family regulator
LLVEHDRFLQRTLHSLLAAEGYACVVTNDAEATRRELERGPFDLVVLHLWRLGREKLALLRAIRERHRMPILVLAADGAVAETVLGLEGGADDYLCEPFDPRELVARVRAQLRRTAEYNRPDKGAAPIRLNHVLLDVARHDAFRDGVALGLTNQEFKLLHLLARHCNRAVASAGILENVWGSASAHGAKVLAVYVGRLRRKIELDCQHPELLVSVRGFGYKLVTESR